MAVAPVATSRRVGRAGRARDAQPACGSSAATRPCGGCSSTTCARPRSASTSARGRRSPTCSASAVAARGARCGAAAVRAFGSRSSPSGRTLVLPQSAAARGAATARRGERLAELLRGGLRVDFVWDHSARRARSSSRCRRARLAQLRLPAPARAAGARTVQARATPDARRGRRSALWLSATSRICSAGIAARAPRRILCAPCAASAAAVSLRGERLPQARGDRRGR